MDDRKRLLNIALILLSSRPRSIHEVRTRLLKKSSNSELVDDVINILIKDQLLDDEKFSQWYIESRSRSRPRSSRMLGFELKKIGVSGPMTDVDDFELAQSALAKKLRLWEHLPKLEARQKAARFLGSRGFSWEIINKVIKLV